MPQPWIQAKRDRTFVEELGLLWRPFSSRPWQDLCNQWQTHVNVFARVKCETPPAGATHISWRATRIEFLFEHLNILDTKFGILLTFNSLLLIALNVLITILLRLLYGSDAAQHTVSRSFQPCVSILVILSVVFGFFWICTTLLCLLGERRLVWGDLGLVFPKPTYPVEGRLQLEDVSGAINCVHFDPAKNGLTTDDAKIKKAEEEHVVALIIAVAKRTNKFRLAIGFTIFNVVLLAAAVVVALVLLYSIFPGAVGWN